LLDLDEALQGQSDLYEHNPRHFSTTVLPYDFDPAAACPLWLQTLRQIFRPRPDRRLKSRRLKVLQEYFGYCLLPHTMKFEKLLVLFGGGGNGKSTIMDILEELLGLDNVSHVPIEKIGGEFWVSRMIGKLANVSADMNWVDRISEGMLKALVSGDRLDANRKNLPQIPFTPTAKLVFGTNTLPPFHDRSNGVWRRLITMPLFGQFEDEDCDVDRVERLLPELPGILNWSLGGARRLLQQGGFTTCEVCQAALDQHRLVPRQRP
jgi:putative DNA primase/helicase